MITEEKTYTCPRCGSVNLVKNGKNRYGNQQYLCKDCRKSGVLNPKHRYSEAQKAQILAAYQERPSMRGIARVYGISRQTLTRWLKKSPDAAPPQGDLAACSGG